MEFQIPEFLPAAAELFVAGMALLVLLWVSFVRRGATVAYWLTLATIVGMVCIALLSGRDVGFTFGQMYIDDPLGDFLKTWVGFSSAVSLLYGRRYLVDRGLETAEYYLIALFAMLGSMIMISAGSLLTMYLGLEMLSLSSYALVAINRDSIQSTEAGMKYFVLGALASGLLLYGISMVYGATQTLNIIDVARALLEQQANRQVLLFGLVFVVAGVGFKFGAVPFHMWLPDVYQGAPTSVTLLVASAPKLAAFAMAFRLLAVGFWDLAAQWQMMLILLAMGSLVIGNLGAIAQTNIKRMLAYSTIGHTGFILLALASGVVGGERYLANNAYAAALFYVVTYVLTTLASFGMVLLMSRVGHEADQIADFKGLNKRNSWWAAMMAIVMFSMAGIPFFVGFFSKFVVLQFIVATDHLWLAVFAVMMSLIGAFYYLRIVKLMYFDEPLDTAPVTAGIGTQVMLSANVLAIAALGLFPDVLIHLCSDVIHGSF